VARKNSKPTTKQRSAKQKLKDRYAHAREDAQLAGLIPTSPEEALKSERVAPNGQGEQAIPSLDRQAITKGWAVPEEKKQLVIKRLLEPFEEEGTVVLTKDGEPITLPPDRDLLQKNAKVLIVADQKQFERDHPEEAGKANGSTNVGVQVNIVNWGAILTEAQQAKERPLEELEGKLAAPLQNGLKELPTEQPPQEQQVASEQQLQ